MLDWKVVAVFHGPSPLAEEPVVVADVVPAPGSEAALAAACRGFRKGHEAWLEGTQPVAPVALDAARLAAAWALRALNEVRGRLFAAGARETAEGARLWLGFHEPALSRRALALALELLAQSGHDPEGAYRARMGDRDELLGACRRLHPDYQARLLMEAAAAQGVPWLPWIEGSRFWQFGWGARARVFFESASAADGFPGHQLARNKVLSLAAMRAMGLPTPAHCPVDREEGLAAAAEQVGWPCVVKPAGAGKGKGVTVGVASMPELVAAFRRAGREGKGPILVEARLPGEDYRLFVVAGVLRWAIRREPPAVTGDGHRSVGTLVEALNTNRLGPGVGPDYLSPVPCDEALTTELERQGYTLDSVPDDGERVRLRSTANHSTGGTCRDVTQAVHPSVRAMAEQVAASAGLGVCGLDYIAPVINRAPGEVGGACIEVNTTPSLDTMPGAGVDALEVGRIVLGARPAPIPLLMVLVADDDLGGWQGWLQEIDLPAGSAWACAGKARAGNLPLQPTGSVHPWAAVRSVLRQHSAERAVLVGGADEVQRAGLPVERVGECLVTASLPSPWWAVLARIAKKVRSAGSDIAAHEARAFLAPEGGGSRGES